MVSIKHATNNYNVSGNAEKILNVDVKVKVIARSNALAAEEYISTVCHQSSLDSPIKLRVSAVIFLQMTVRQVKFSVCQLSVPCSRRLWFKAEPVQGIMSCLLNTIKILVC